MNQAHRNKMDWSSWAWSMRKKAIDVTSRMFANDGESADDGDIHRISAFEAYFVESWLLKSALGDTATSTSDPTLV
jgi:hypothetical protein